MNIYKNIELAEAGVLATDYTGAYGAYGEKQERQVIQMKPQNVGMSLRMSMFTKQFQSMVYNYLHFQRNLKV